MIEHDNEIKKVFFKENFCKITEVDKETFFLFLDKFGQALIGHKYFNDNMKSKFNFSKVCTVSDEAFAKFTFERCWATWESEIKRTTNPQEIIVKPKHTKEKSNKKFGGWDQEGLQRFSKIAELITAERKMINRQENEEAYRLRYYEKLHSFGNAVKTDNDNGTTENSYVAYNDLGSDDDMCVMHGNSNTQDSTVRVEKHDDDQLMVKESDSVYSGSQEIEYGQKQQLKEYGK